MRLFAFLFALIPSIAFCAGAIVQSAYTPDAEANLTATVSLTGVTAGHAIALQVGWSSGTTVSSIVDSNSQSYSVAVGAIEDPHDDQDGALYYLANSTGGNVTITVTFSADTDSVRLRATELSGIAASGILDQAVGQYQSAPGTGAGAVSSGASSATTNANDFVLGFSQDTSEADPGTGTMTAGTGYTIDSSGTGAGRLIILATESQNVSSTGAQTATFTQSVNNYRITFVAAFKTAGGSSCTHAGYTSVGALATPNGSSGSYWLKNGTFGTPDCSTVNYWQPAVGNFGTN